MAKAIDPWDDGWETVGKLGKGGQGHTKRVRRKGAGVTEGDWALKVLHLPNDPERRRRMHREVTALRGLQHPNIPKLIEANTERWDETDVGLYIVSELIVGSTLGMFVTPQQVMSLESAIGCASKLVQVVSYCHGQRIVHRDLKPDNIILRNDNPLDPVVLDFGLAFSAIEDEDSTLTPSLQQLGNRFLHLPELETSGRDRRDYRSDLSQCCGVLFFLLTGHPPVVLVDHDGLKPHERERALSILFKIPAERRERLVALFNKGFQSALNSRFQTANELLVALSDVLVDRPPDLALDDDTKPLRSADLIAKKRDGDALKPREIKEFIDGVITSRWPDHQLSAMLMAINLRGMTFGETASFTKAIADSGKRLDLSDVPGRKVNKHGTGGVGDKTTLVVVPLAAACGVILPLSSGRGLGHVGGTIDKLESVPGFRATLSEGEIRAALGTVGASFCSATADFAPADRKLYALRDVTATVPSVPLITASILAKQLAFGVDALILDVKCGQGAFMKRRVDALGLAESLVTTGQSCGLQTAALVTAMDAPLGHAIGNALEVREALNVLEGRGPIDIETLAVALAARMLVMGRVSESLAGAESRVRDALSSGRGVEKFRAILMNQGGDPNQLPVAPDQFLVRASRHGFVTEINPTAVGQAASLLGAGRLRVEDAIDHSVGVVVKATVGDDVREGDVLAEVHYQNQSALGLATRLLRDAWRLDESPPETASLIIATRGLE